MNLIKKLPFYRRYTTEQNKKYWQKRKGWEEYQNTADHPHRHFITHILKQLRWVSLFEIGCGSGPNLVNIAKSIGGKQLGGVDINPEAIELAKQTFKGGVFKVGSGDDILMTDKSVDIILTDMFLIYVGPFRIKRYLHEFKRIARNNLVLVEYHSRSWWKRQYLMLFSGRHAYDYKRLLEKCGYYDVTVIKMPVFEEDNEQSYRHILLAKVPKL